MERWHLMENARYNVQIANLVKDNGLRGGLNYTYRRETTQHFELSKTQIYGLCATYVDCW